MLQQDEPRDYVVGTGKSNSVRDFVRLAFESVGLNWENHVVIDPKFYRPAEVDLLEADSGRADRELGWRPEVCFESLVERMVHADLERWRSASPPIFRLRAA